MKPSQLKYRHELKYLMSYPDYVLVKMRIQQIMKLDRNASSDGYYVVRSLYFDDYHNSAYHEKQQGVPERKKYRIRIYNYSDNLIQLECKYKVNRYVRKETAPLTRQEFSWLINGSPQFLLNTEFDLHKIFYHEYVSNVLRPRVIVDYEREPFVLPVGDVRVTFDKNVRAGMGGFALFDKKLSTTEVLPSGNLVMEVKFTEFLPEIVRQTLTSGVSEFLAISKYIMCCDQTPYKHNLN